MPTPTYDLHTLGWSSFQDLCHTISRQILGQTVQRFSDSKDGGRDGAFEGTWTDNGQESFAGSLVIQCKFIGKADQHLTPSAISDELDKAKRLVSDGRCTTYILMTNAKVTGTTEEKIVDAYRSVGVQHVLTLDGDWVRQQISENPELRSLVPRVYGLGDLSQILDARANAQTRAILNSMQDDLATVVITDAYQRAAVALRDHSLALLLGPPASGKTTIASQLTMVALDLWEAQTYRVERPEHIRDHWNPHEPHQFFWVDDAFGNTQYDASLVTSWNRQLPALRAMLKRGVRIVLTSRDYIYRRAKENLKARELPVLNEAQVVVKVQDFSQREREQMLYNHIKLGGQSTAFRRRIKRHLPSIAANPQFIPEIARRLSNPQFTNALAITENGLREFVEKPEAFLEETITGLDDDSRAALSLLFMHGDALDVRLDLSPSGTLALERMASDVGGCAAALRALDGALVRYSPEPRPVWQFRHPTVKDAVSTFLAKKPDLVDVLVEGSEPQKLMSQITCGNVGLENAVIVDESLFDKVGDVLDSTFATSDEKPSRIGGLFPGSALASFLVNRCSEDFLRFYVRRNPHLAGRLTVSHQYLGTDPNAQLASRLHEYELLPEQARFSIVESIVQRAFDESDFWDVDLAAIKFGPIANIISKTEIDSLSRALKEDVIPWLDDVRESWEDDYSRDEPADSWMEPLVSYCHSAKQFFQDEEGIVERFEDQEMYIEHWISEHYQEDPADDWKQWAEQQELSPAEDDRSIFDDLDME